MAVNTPLQRAGKDHRLYTWFAITMPLLVLIGFARTYYLKGVFSGPALPSTLVHVHGAVMTSWVVLFVVQVWLVASRRTKVHQRLGVIGSVLALLVPVIGTSTALAAAARDSRSQGAGPLQFLIVPLGDMLLFAIFVGGALYFRRRLDIHKRLMLLGAAVLLAAAVSRIPLNFIATGGPLVFFGLTNLFLVAFVVVDTIKHRKLHPVFLWGTLVFIIFQLRLLLAGTNAWMHFAAWLVGFIK